MPAAIEEQHPQRFLQFDNPLRQRGHRQMQALCGNGEIGAGRGPVKSFQLFERHYGGSRFVLRNKFI
jgi:hypothetical protein